MGMIIGTDDVTLRVADFSPYPIGRDETDGQYNGTRYRKEVLVPAVRAATERGTRVIISFADVMSFGSSFLEEAFGGLVSKEGFDKEAVLKVIKVAKDENEPDMYGFIVTRMIKDAKPNPHVA